jgi:glycosyltransferase involved in cell wall biosynthesis
VRSTVLTGSGIDTQAFAFVPPPPGPTTFLLIARLLGDKGVREYVAAARILTRKYPHAVFQLVGWIDTNPDAIRPDELNEWIKEGAIEYLGRLNDVQPAIAACSVYVLPSYREGTPRTVLEAMAIGRPIVTTDAPGCRETVVHEDNGLLVAVKSVDQLVAAMQRFLDDPKLAARMGRRSREIAETKFDVRNVSAVMLKEMGFSEA